MKIKTSDLIGPALDWTVAKCEGHTADVYSWLYEATLKEVEDGSYHPSTDWSQGGPIIEREFVEVRPGSFIGSKERPRLWAAWGQTRHGDKTQGKTGPTPLIAAMRCYVASKLGDTIDIPEELL